mmetsp:Transcript_5353/g.12155  ORF Transcript_5353/g.12155 Transcript_5353/m.12155 type:complete len:487 (+) Transcript_5353:597-2057(+)
MAKKSNTPSIQVDTDAAKRALILLDTISIIKVATRALGDFKSMYLDNIEYTGKHIPKKAINEIDMIIDGLKYEEYISCEETRDEETSDDETSENGRVPNKSRAACELEDFKSKYFENLTKQIPKKAISGVDTIIKALDLIHDKARTQAASVCSVTYLLKAYDRRSKLEREKEGSTKKYYSHQSNSISESSFRITEYVKCRGGLDTKKREREQVFDNNELDRRKRSRKAPIRLETETIVTPNKSKIAPSGEPPNGEGMWTKRTIIEAMSKLEGSGLTKQFIVNMLKVGKTTYSSDSGLYVMYNKWKKNGFVRNGAGRPCALGLDKVDAKIATKFRDRSGNSSAFQLSDMKNIIEGHRKDTAEEAGLDPDSINCGVCDTTAKVNLIAAAMGDSGGNITNKKLLIKTLSRYGGENSVQGGVANALTAMTTNNNAGRCPPHLPSLRGATFTMTRRGGFGSAVVERQETEKRPVLEDVGRSTLKIPNHWSK